MNKACFVLLLTCTLFGCKRKYSYRDMNKVSGIHAYRIKDVTSEKTVLPGWRAGLPLWVGPVGCCEVNMAHMQEEEGAPVC